MTVLLFVSQLGYWLSSLRLFTVFLSPVKEMVV